MNIIVKVVLLMFLQEVEQFFQFYVKEQELFYVVYKDCMEEIIEFIVVQGIYELIEVELAFGVRVVW